MTPVADGGGTPAALYRPFFAAAIGVALTLGTSWGVLLLLRIAREGSFTAVGVHEVNAHGHAQVFGWVGLFVMGFLYQALPRIKHTSLSCPRLARSTLWLMLGGLALRALGEPLAAQWPWMAAAALAGSAAEVAAVVAFAGIVAAVLRKSPGRLEAPDWYLLAALGWFVVQAVYEPVYFAATLGATDREHLLRLIATWQGPLREIQVQGFATLMILGMSQRLLPAFFGIAAPGPARSLVVLVVVNAAVLGMVAGLVLMGLAGHAWAGLWYVSVLALAGGVLALCWGGMPLASAGRADRSLKFIRAAHVWLLISLAMLVALPAYQLAVLPALAPQSAAAKMGFSHAYYGAIRHAATVGFVSLMMAGVASRVVPVWRGIDLRRLTGLWLPFGLLNAGCALRVSAQTLTDFIPSAFPLAGASGLLELAGLAIWGGHLLRIMYSSDPAFLQTSTLSKGAHS